MLNFYAKLIEFTILSEHALTQNKCTVVTSISSYELKLENPSWLWLGCRIIKYWMFHVIFSRTCWIWKMKQNLMRKKKKRRYQQKVSHKKAELIIIIRIIWNPLSYWNIVAQTYFVPNWAAVVPYSYVWWNSSFKILNVSNEQKLKHLWYFFNINFATDVNFFATFFLCLFLF